VKATLAAAGMTATVAVEDVAALVQEQDDSNQLTGEDSRQVAGKEGSRWQVAGMAGGR
jgi:hypothetical protein